MTTTNPVDPGQMRIGDAEREQLADRLRRAHDAGQIDLDEFDQRVQQAYRARVRSDLDALVRDLPGTGRAATPAPPAADREASAPWAAEQYAHWQSVGSRALQRRSCGHGASAASRASGRPASHRRHGGGVPRAVWIVLAVLVALSAGGFILGLAVRVLFTVALVVGMVVLVKKGAEYWRK